MKYSYILIMMSVVFLAGCGDKTVVMEGDPSCNLLNASYFQSLDWVDDDVKISVNQPAINGFIVCEYRWNQKNLKWEKGAINVNYYVGLSGAADAFDWEFENARVGVERDQNNTFVSVDEVVEKGATKAFWFEAESKLVIQTTGTMFTVYVPSRNTKEENRATAVEVAGYIVGRIK